MATQTVRTALGTVEYAEGGDGPPVLVVHGSPGGWDQGWLMARILVDAGFRAIAPSRPGYLGTALTGQTTSIDGQADLHAALLDALGIDRCGVMCWSGGGPSSYRLAVLHPERVHRLVALAAVSRRYEWDLTMSDKLVFGTRPGNWLISQMSAHSPKQLISGTLQSEGDLTKDEVREMTEQVLADPVKRDFVIGLADTVSYRGARREGMENDRATFATITDLELPRVSAPVLLVQGTADSDVDPSYSAFASDQISAAELLEMDRGTHLSLFIGPDEAPVQERVLAHLRAQ